MDHNFYTTAICHAVRNMARDAHSVESTLVDVESRSVSEIYDDMVHRMKSGDKDTCMGFTGYLLAFNRPLMQMLIVDEESDDFEWSDFMTEPYDHSEIAT